MNIIVFLFVLVQINVLLGIEGSDLSVSKCSRIVATPHGKSDPIILVANEDSQLRGKKYDRQHLININDGSCYMEEKRIGEPCYRNPEYYNITISNVEEFEDILLDSTKGYCIVKFVPDCVFKPPNPGEVVLQESFPFVRFNKGNEFVRINFSVKGRNSTSISELWKEERMMCRWKGKTVDQNKPENYCRNFTENMAKDQLDYTLEYQRVDKESNTSFEFASDISRVGVTVYWDEEGVSPDIIDCQRHKPVTTTTTNGMEGVTTTTKEVEGLTTTTKEIEGVITATKEIEGVTTTSKGCAIAYTFSIVAGISQWIFQ